MEPTTTDNGFDDSDLFDEESAVSPGTDFTEEAEVEDAELQLQRMRAMRADLAQYLLGGGHLAVVKAPPGSGKTHTLIEVLSTLAAEGKRVAVAAQTSQSVTLRLTVPNACCRKGRWTTATCRASDRPTAPQSHGLANSPEKALRSSDRALKTL